MLHTVATLMSVGQKPVDILAALLADRSTTPICGTSCAESITMSGVDQILAMPRKNGTALASPELVEELQAYSNLPGFGEQIRAIAADWRH